MLRSPLSKAAALKARPARATLRYSYGATGRLGGLRSSSATYLSGVAYTPIGQVAQYDRSGTTSSSTAIGYDQATGAVSQLQETTLTGTTFTVTGNRLYTRDKAGNVSKIATTASGVVADTQCFNYDYLQNLAAAWTPTSNACTTAPTSTTIGGVAPYWTTYAVDPTTGNRTQTVAKPATSTAQETRYDYTYPAAATAHPHAVTNVLKQIGTATPTNTGYAVDASGNTTARSTQVLEYNPAGKLAKTTVGSVTQKNVYDASGQLLIRIDSSAGSTLFIGDTELNMAAGATVASGVRTYTANETALAERTSTAGGTTTTLNWLSVDLVNTSTMSIDASTGAIVRRYLDPYGNKRGTAATWSSNHKYLNAPSSTVTGLTHLGAREYDPVLGRFITVDSVLSPMNPQQNNGYSYAGNNPVTRADPSGDCFSMEGYNCAQWNRISTARRAASGSAPPAAAGSPSSGGGVSVGGQVANGARQATSNKSHTAAIEPVAMQNAFALILGVATTAIIAAAVIACVAATVGLCAVAGAGFLAAGVMVAGAAGSVMTYDNSSGAKDLNGYTQAVAGGAILGGIAPGAGALLNKVALKAVAPVTKSATQLPIELTVGNNAKEGVHVYQGVVDGEAAYTGITNNLGARTVQHGARFDSLQQVTSSTLTRGEARAVEQSFIADDRLTNIINSISPKHPYYDDAVNWGREWRANNGH